MESKGDKMNKSKMFRDWILVNTFAMEENEFKRRHGMGFSAAHNAYWKSGLQAAWIKSQGREPK